MRHAVGPSLAIAVALVGVAALLRAQGHAQQSIVPLKPFAMNQEIEIVSGNPDSAGAPFVLRIKNDDGMIVPVHWHPTDEHIVVVKGTWYLGSGDRFDRGVLREMHVGDYGFVPKEMLHFAWSRGQTVIQVHGIGPFRILPPNGERWDSLGDPSANFKFHRRDLVLTPRGEGIVVDAFAARNARIVQYRIQRRDGSLSWLDEADVRPKKSPSHAR